MPQTKLFLKIFLNVHVPSHGFKKINAKIFWKFQKKIETLFKNPKCFCVVNGR